MTSIWTVKVKLVLRLVQACISHCYAYTLYMFPTLFRVSDTAMNILLKFLSMFFVSVGKQVPANFTFALPASLYSAWKFSSSNRDQFKRYVCCPTFHSIYLFQDCVIKLANGQMESRTCSFVRFPTHPQCQHHAPCSTPLLHRNKNWEVITVSMACKLL